MSHTDPEEGLDFYYEDGLVVFTAEYLRQRGFCCRSGCRHCPYGYREQDGSTPSAPSSSSGA